MNNSNIYMNSLTRHGNSTLFIAKEDDEKILYVFGEGEAYNILEGEKVLLPDGKAKRCPLNNTNAKTIRKLFPFTNPVSHKGHPFTMGLGDRLGLASPGHIKLISLINEMKNTNNIDVFPVLAQQSMRELNLTGRTYDDVLAAAVWAVFQEGYRNGYGADGDHLKTYDEVRMALDCGFSMITLDCSEHIRNDIMTFDDSEIDHLYNSLDRDVTAKLESDYADKIIWFDGGASIAILLAELKRIILIYLGAIKHTVNIYNDLICGKRVDFEMSVDETSFTTSPQAHYFVASELKKAGVEITSIAPRFCGEFQKGIDYRGDVNEFTKEFTVHAKIANKLGYKLSIHSGSDKFTVFPIIYKETGRVVHVKTAGTNWLEALRVIANKNPGLFREIYKYALENLAEAKKYYHITENINNIPDINSLGDCDLPSFLDQNDSRQVLHVTYGLILSAKNSDGTFIYKNAIYTTLNQYENDYYDALIKHIRLHIVQ